MDSQRMHVIANKPGKEPPLPIIGEPFESNYRPRVPLDNEEVEEAQNFSFFVEDASSMAGDILGRGEHLPGKGESTFNPKLSSKKSPQNNGPVSERMQVVWQMIFVEEKNKCLKKENPPGLAYKPKPPPKKPPQNNGPVSEVESENRSFFVEDASGMANDIRGRGEQMPEKGEPPGLAYKPKPPPKKPPQNNGPVSERMQVVWQMIFVEEGEQMPEKGEPPGLAYKPKPPPKKPPQNNGPVSEVESENRSFFVEDASGMANDIRGREEQMPEKGEPPGLAYKPKPPPKKPPQNNGPVSEVESENRSFFVEDASGMANDIRGREEQMPEKGEPPGLAYKPKPPPKKPPQNNGPVSEVESENRSFFVEDASGMANDIRGREEHLPEKGEPPEPAYKPKPTPKKPPQNNGLFSEVEAQNHAYLVEAANLMAPSNGRKQATRNEEQQGDQVQNGTTRAADTTLQQSPRASPDRYVMRAQITSDKRHALFKTWEEREQAKAEVMANKKLYSLELWANKAKAALEAEMRQIQEKYAVKMNKLADVNRTTEEKKALLEASKKEEFLKLEEMAAQIRATGYKPKKRLMSCFSCINFSD
ncbi:Remorin [Morella rubra]|uniref:Remorin n=2 Tax=Morella rubra TaxID=262757 RepID=A0A6A1WDY9_9ROSI|nr:Remorin [Morella rubra]